MVCVCTDVLVLIRVCVCGLVVYVMVCGRVCVSVLCAVRVCSV